MSTELFFNKPVSGAFSGSIQGDRGAAVSFFGSASFAPKDHPKNNQLNKKNQIIINAFRYHMYRLIAAIEMRSQTSSARSAMFSILSTK